MKMSAIIDDFSRGEVSPLTLAKLASAEVKNGLSSNINMIADPRGPLIGRQGFKYIADIPATALYATLFQFEMYEGKSLCIVFYDDQVTIYNASTEEVTVDTLATPYTDATLHGTAHDRHNLEGVLSPDGTQIYFLHESVAPYVMTIADLGTPSDTDLDVTFAAVSFTAAPAEWTGSNYPTTMTFFQDRTWWAGCADNPETFWGSKSDDHTDMTQGALADDAVEFTLQKDGKIKWLSGHSTLLIGTSWGEFIASGSAVVIEPGDIQIDPQSAYGSKRVTPEFIGDEVLYVSADGLKLRSMWWRWVESGWKSMDLTYTGEHLTQGGIKDIAYCRDPDSLIWMLTEEDDLVCCSFRRKNDNDPAVGWSQTQFSDNITKITGMTAVRNNGKSALWVAVQTEVNSVAKLHLMRQDTLNLHEDDLVMLDNYSTHTPGTGITTITGLSHLEGQTVSVVGDGAVLPEETVASGEIELDYHYDSVQVGHKYTQTMVTLPHFVYEKQMGHQMKRWSKIWCYVLSSFPPEINGKRPPTRNASTAMGEGEEGTTGLIQVYDTGWDREAKITVEQDIPKQLIVLGIFGEVNLEAV